VLDLSRGPLLSGGLRGADGVPREQLGGGGDRFGRRLPVRRGLLEAARPQVGVRRLLCELRDVHNAKSNQPQMHRSCFGLHDV